MLEPFLQYRVEGVPGLYRSGEVHRVPADAHPSMASFATSARRRLHRLLVDGSDQVFEEAGRLAVTNEKDAVQEKVAPFA